MYNPIFFMKNTNLLLSLLILSAASIAQIPFVGVSAHSKGFSLQAGLKAKNTIALIGYSKPLTSAVNPFLFFGNIGYEFNLKPKIKDGYSITPLVGISYYTFDDVDKEQTIKGFAPIYSLELGKDYYNGRLFTNISYCKVFYFGGGFKIFIN
jgi:hypothetical protein